MPDPYPRSAGLFARTLHSKPEDRVTEVLAALLREDETWEDALTALFPRLDQKPKEVSTQFVGEDSKRPDLLLRWDTVSRFLEVKFDAPTTDAQDKGYAGVLAEERKRGVDAELYFLAPEYRRGKLSGILEDAGQPSDHFISWSDVHSAMAVGVSAYATKLSGPQWWLKELVEAIDKEAFVSATYVPFETEEAVRRFENPGWARDFGNLLNAVDAIRRLVSQSFAVSSIQTGHAEGLCYGFSFSPAGWKYIWFGFWLAPLSGQEGGPLWLQAMPDDGKGWPGAHGWYPWGDGSRLCPFSVPAGEDEAGLFAQLRRLLLSIQIQFAEGEENTRAR